VWMAGIPGIPGILGILGIPGTVDVEMFSCSPVFQFFSGSEFGIRRIRRIGLDVCSLNENLSI